MVERVWWVKKEILPLFDQGKELEVRVQAPKLMKRVHRGDVLIFNEQVRRWITEIRTYASFDHMMRHEDPKKIIPGRSEYEVIMLLRKIYSWERERKGVYVFQLAKETEMNVHRFNSRGHFRIMDKGSAHTAILLKVTFQFPMEACIPTQHRELLSSIGARRGWQITWLQEHLLPEYLPNFPKQGVIAVTESLKKLGTSMGERLVPPGHERLIEELTQLEQQCPELDQFLERAIEPVVFRKEWGMF